MNAIRRKELVKIMKRLEGVQEIIDDLVEDLNNVKEDEQGALDNMPESLQDSERGQLMEENIEAMESAADDLECIDIESIIDSLQEIVDMG